ncbi:Bcl-2-like protein 15 [Oryzias melastigma]|uniref:Bcl-2-like protein 15 n=1 Tax=Oryzias melastigma TaxID=30732 RepID=A0A834C499_ORYME|nr:Bcl-2-like protein 15 [Oryzias melastigma]
MAPTDAEIRSQTDQIVYFLLAGEDEAQKRMFTGEIVPDGPGDDFDPVLIAQKLRAVGDALNDEAHFRAALSDLQKAAAVQAIEAAFIHSVEVLCETHCAKAAEVAPEIQQIKASVALGVYVAKKAPELRSKVHSALTSFLTTRVGGWVAQQGGWGRVRDLDG